MILYTVLSLVIVLLLAGIAYHYFYQMKKDDTSAAAEIDESGADLDVNLPPPPASEGLTGEQQYMKKNAYEAMADKAMSENAEYYTTCGDGKYSKRDVDCACGDGPFNFGKYAFGAPDMSYTDYVTSQGVDDRAIIYHAQFVKDRKGLGPTGEFVTGRTYSPDSHDSYDPIPWVGIRGRHKTGKTDILCGGRSVPDIDTNLFKGNRPFCMST